MDTGAIFVVVLLLAGIGYFVYKRVNDDDNEGGGNTPSTGAPREKLPPPNAA